jgi:hypothetical protein
MSRFVSTLVLLLCGTTMVHAQLFDHLQCYKIKDSVTKTVYSADLTPSEPALVAAPPTCKVKVPAKLLCVATDKTNVTPLPPGSPPGAPGQTYLCYKVKCPKVPTTLSVQDQFGAHSVLVKSSSLLCAPAPAATTTTIVVTTTTVPISTTSTTFCIDLDMDGFCGNVNDCNDTNPNIKPSAVEVCNNVDDDCDAMTDEGLGQTTCGMGACQNTVQNCVGGVPQSCTPGPPGPETCNNIDDDCDGSVDDGLGSTTCGTGACQNTVQNCVGGSPQPCFPGTPGTETCNGIDDDCDGQTDECPPPPNATAMCVSGSCTLGACSAGYGDCNANPVDGCEVFIMGSDPNNCGSCNVVCNDGNPCTFDNCNVGSCSFQVMPNNSPCPGGTCQGGVCTP